MDPLSDISIRRADPGETAIRRLIKAHVAHSRDSSPPISDHTYGVQALSAPDIRLWVVSSQSIGVVACGALKSLPDGTAEVKSVHVDALARGRGLARVLMVHLVGTAKSDGYSALVLETGTMDEYSAARGLYEALGFVYCDPIFGYGPDSNSAFMRLPLDPANLSPQ